ncbi:MAG: iron ABC transporter permease [Bacteroidales bacterium]|nr:iron ABC transporter permease [Bacteroidales bacterium]
MKNQTLNIIIVTVLMLVSILLSFTIGENGINLHDLLTGKIDNESVDWIIFKEIRLPRVLMSTSCGALICMAGCIMQGIFRNPLVEPYTLGLSGGAMLGVGIAVGFGLNEIWGGQATTICALFGALATALIVLTIRKIMGGSTTSMLLAGVMISFATSSISTLIMCLSSKENIAQITSWSIGSFELANTNNAFTMCILAIIATALLPFAGNILNAMSIGDEAARHIGIDTGRAVVALFAIASTMTALCVSQTGIIAFAGLIVPQAIRLIFAIDFRQQIILSSIGGAAFLTLCDITGREIIYPRELPAGILSGIIGGIVFIYILIKQNAKN